MADSTSMRTVLVTGFESFGVHSRNPTGDAIRVLSADPELMRVASFLVLPVTWRGAPEILVARRWRERSLGCLAFGLAAKSSEMRIERAAYNVSAADAVDNAGVRGTGEPLVPGSPEIVHASRHADAIRDALIAVGAPVVDSNDPGRYICNATYYAALCAGSQFGFDALFVHVPPTRSSGGVLADETLRAWMRGAILRYAAVLQSPK